MLVFRWMHILAAIVAVGGTAFTRFALLPAAGALPGDERDRLMEGVRSRWSKFVAGAILFLLVSGLYNFITTMKMYELPKPYQMVFGIKFLLAFVIFALASLLSGRSAAAQKLRKNARFWVSLNLALGVLVVCLSGFLRAIPHNPNREAEPATTATHVLESPAHDS
jgi:uncharacterized membrane protein